MSVTSQLYHVFSPMSKEFSEVVDGAYGIGSGQVVSGQQAVAHVQSFLDGYGDGCLESRLIKAIALGAIMYRLDSVIQYSIDLSDEGKSKILETVERVLSTSDLGSIPWPELTRMAL